MTDYIKHKKIVIASDNVAQALGASYEEVENLNIHAKSSNSEVAYFGASSVLRSGANEAGVPLVAGANLPYTKAELSRLYVNGKTGDIFLLSYNIRENN